MDENDRNPWWRPSNAWSFAGFTLTMFFVSTGVAGLITRLRGDPVETQSLWMGAAGIFALAVSLVLYLRWKSKS